MKHTYVLVKKSLGFVIREVKQIFYLSVDLVKRIVKVEGKEVKLSPKEYYEYLVTGIYPLPTYTKD